MIRRSLALLVALLVGLPWAVLPVSAGGACDKGMPKAESPCNFCAPDSRPASATATLSAGCCTYSANTEAAPAQASGVSFTPKTHLSPDAPVAALPGLVAITVPNVVRISRSSQIVLPAHAPPTETTQLLL